MDRNARLAPLGLQRLRVLDCLGGNNRWAAGYFEPDADADVVAEFQRYVVRMLATWAAESEPAARSLLAAARVLTGDLAAAQAIVDHLPATPIELDHGAGICASVPLHALSTALPLPPTLADTRQWRAGSPEQDALRAWLAAHAGELRWREADGVYEWSARRPAPPLADAEDPDRGRR